MATSKISNNPELCSWCHSSTRKLLSLQCDHHFCESCSSHLERQEKDGVEEIYCSLCTKYIISSDIKGSHNIEKMAKMFAKIYRDKIQNIPKASTTKVAKPCGQCEGSSSEMFCMECKMTLCQTCQRTHLKLPACKDHTIVTLESLSLCGQCEKSKPEQFCNTCSIPLCGTCQRTHLRMPACRYHSISSFGDMFPGLGDDSTADNTKVINSDKNENSKARPTKSDDTAIIAMSPQFYADKQQRQPTPKDSVSAKPSPKHSFIECCPDIDLATTEIFNIIKHGEHSWLDFFKFLRVYKAQKYFTPETLLSEEGLNILHACLDIRIDYIGVIMYIGWWKVLCDQKVPEGGVSKHIGRTAMQIAETNKRSLDEFTLFDDWENSLTSLMIACRDGNVSHVKQLIEVKEDLYHCDSNNCNALYWAVIAGNEEIFKLLVSADLNITMQTKQKKNSLLNIACICGQRHIIRLLLGRHKIDPWLKNVDNFTALDIVSQQGNLDILKEFIKCGVNPQPCAVPISALNGQLTYLTYLIEELGMDVDAVDNDGDNGLQCACLKGSLDIASYLVSKGANLMVRCQMGRTILHILAKSGKKEVTSWVISLLSQKEVLGKLLNVQSKFNGEELSYIVTGNDKGRHGWHYVEVDRDKLHEYNAKLGGTIDVGLYGKTLKSGWGKGPDEDVKAEIKALYKKKRQDPNLPADMTPLHCALFKGHDDIARMLIDAGADLHVKDKFGSTALMYATSAENEEMISFLKANGAKY